MLARIQLTLAAGLMLVALALGGVLLFGGSDGVSVGADTGLDAGPQGFVGSVSPQDIPPRDFTLTDQAGRSTPLAAERGKVVVLTFMYSTCEDTCPTTAQQIRLALNDLGAGARDVKVLAVSVDPRNDTPLTAKTFINKQSLTGRMRFLLGTEAQLKPIWSAYGIQPQSDDKQASLEAEHSATVLLIGRDGRQRVSFPVDQLTPERLAHDLGRLLRRS